MDGVTSIEVYGYASKAAQTITAEDVTVTYGDTDKSVSATVTEPTTGGGEISYAVKTGSEDYIEVASDGKLTIKKVPSDGKAYVTVTAAATDDYAQATKEVTVTINTKAMTVSAENVTATVDGQPHGITVNVTDPNSGYTVKYGTEEGSYTLDASPTQTEVGTLTVYYQVTADNYTTKTGSATVTIRNYTALTEANKPTITVSGDHNPPQVGDTLTASTTATDITYLWFRRQPIEGGYSYERIWDDEAGQVSHTADTYTLTAEDAGYEIFAVAYQTKGSNGETLTGDQRPEVMSDATAAVVKKQRSGLTLSPATAQYVYAAGSVPTFTASTDSFASQTPVIYYSTGRFTTGMIAPTLNSTIHPWSEVTNNTKLNAGEYYVAAYYPATGEYDAFLTPFVILKVEKGTRGAPSKAASVEPDKLTATLAATDKGKALEFAIDGTSDWTLVTADANGVFLLGALATGAHTLYLRQQADVNYNATEASEGLAFDLTKHSVSYNANGGTGAPDTQISASAITVNTTVRPTRSGYTFAGWYEDASGTTAAKTSYTTSVTLYAKWTANSYKVKFNANGGTGTMADQSLTYDGGATALTAIGFTAPGGKHFVGWATGANGAVLYSDKQNVKNLTAEANGVVDLFAVWADNVYSVTATINSGTDSTVSVKLVRGSTELQSDSVTISSGTGTASFAGVPAGTYNIVVKQGDKTVTAAVVITTASENVTVTIPSTDTSSVLKVEEDARPVVVDGLDAEAESKAQDGSTVTVEMNVSKQEDQELSANATEEQRETQAAIESIKEEMDKTDPLAANEEREVEYMNIDLTKTVTPSGGSGQKTPLTETTNVIAVLIPFDMTGKNIASLNLFRYHDGKATALAKHSGNGKPTTTYADGSFYVDLLNSFIYLYTNQFSTYAISYTETTSTPTPTPTPTPHYPSSGGNGSYSPSTYTPVITDTQHGKVTVSPTSPTSGAKVTITVKPDAGYEVDTLTLTDASGRSVTYTDNDNNTYTFTQPSSKVTVNVTFKPEQAAPTADVFAPFNDLDKTKWYADGIRYVLENGIMSGYGNGTFAPNDNTSRAMMAQILFNLEGGKSASDAMSYVDVNNADWFAEAIRWASAQGVMGGYGNGVFGPNDDLTREQLVTIMYRYAKNKGINVSVGEDTNILSYNDAFDVSEWAIPAMRWAVGSGLITGRTASTLNPKDKATRAEIATIIMRYCEEIAK